jgi:hypothetical protein
MDTARTITAIIVMATDTTGIATATACNRVKAGSDVEHPPSRRVFCCLPLEIAMAWNPETEARFLR